MAYLGYIAFRAVVFIFSFVPFWLLYAISDVLSFVFNKVLKYRHKVIDENLKRCFPYKTNTERVMIKNAFYNHLADITLESLKGFSMSTDIIKKRFTMAPQANMPPQNAPHIITAAHYGNWEWSAFAIPLYLPTHSVLGFYKPLTNKYINRHLVAKRAKTGCILASIKQTNEFFDHYAHTNGSFLLAGDQNPSNIKDAIWVKFFGIDTPCLHGIEKYATRYNLPVYYGEICKVKRGYYELKMKLISKHPNELSTTTLTQKFMDEVNASIDFAPQYWLWSHKRWKHIDNQVHKPQ
jgi:Kdo2-lipid IVA lauroyltransferase/acyltransferase